MTRKQEIIKRLNELEYVYKELEAADQRVSRESGFFEAWIAYVGGALGWDEYSSICNAYNDSPEHSRYEKILRDKGLLVSEYFDICESELPEWAR